MIKKAQLIIYLSTGLFLIVDRFFKYQSLHDWSTPNLTNKYLGWMPYLNPGIGFGLPVPNVIIIILTIPIIILVGYLIFNSKKINNKQLPPKADQPMAETTNKHNNTPTIQQFNNLTISSFIIHNSLFIILLGALSNFVDRVIYHHTVDYLLTLTSLYNLADVMIVAGFVIYLFAINQENKKT